MTELSIPTSADSEIRECLAKGRSFFVIAGAGSGKTASLLSSLETIRELQGKLLRRDGQRIVCVTYTKRAVAVISERLRWDDLYLVSTLHSFLWSEVRQFTSDICRVLAEDILPSRIAKMREADKGGESKGATEARLKADTLARERECLKDVAHFTYGDSQYSNYVIGELSHDDVITVAAHLIMKNVRLRKMLGQKYPYIFVDEAQDTHEEVVQAFNALCDAEGLPIVGYFGDPMQQIYDKRAGEFSGPSGSIRIHKTENFRCSIAVVDFLNAFRKDLQQIPAGKNAEIAGSVLLRLIKSENPDGERNRYSEEQLDRASAHLNSALVDWEWAERTDVKQLYLVRQMIARRLGFNSLHRLFTSEHSSSRSQDDYESGEHYLLKPFTTTLERLVRAHANGDERQKIDILRGSGAAYNPKGPNGGRTLKDMLTRAQADVAELVTLWESTVGDVLRFAQLNGLCPISERLDKALARDPRTETYEESIHGAERSDWLADKFLCMSLEEIGRYCDFLADNTPFSTQHGVKGEQYPNVLVVFDDVGSAWNNYSFNKTLTPKTEGKAPTERQQRLSNNLAYVCFSRAETNLRIVMFTSNPEGAKAELVERGLLSAQQIQI